MTNNTQSPAFRVINGGQTGQDDRRFPQPARRPLRTIQPDQFPLFSDEEAWSSRPVTSSAWACGRPMARGVWLSSGSDFSFPVSCRTYGCKRCASTKAESKLRRFIMAAERIDKMHFTTFDGDASRLSDRLYDNRAFEDDGYVWVTREGESIIWAFATLPLEGLRPPRTMDAVPPEDAVRLFTFAVSLPGVRRVQFSRNWPEQPQVPSDEEDPAPSPWESFGVVHDERWEDIKERAAELALHRHGIRVDPASPYISSGSRGDSVRKWVDCLKTIIAGQ